MRYEVLIRATVEADNADAAEKQVKAGNAVKFSEVVVTPAKKWAVTLTVPVVYTFDLVVSAETKDDAERIAQDEIDWLDNIEDFVTTEIVDDYQHDIDTFSCQVEKVEPLEDQHEPDCSGDVAA